MNIRTVFHCFHSRKPEHNLLPSGTFFLIDTANLLGHTGPQHAARTLGAVSADLSAQGYRAVFFLEYRSYIWVRRRQDSERDASLLDAFVGREDFALVDEDVGLEKSEADAIILQAAEALPGSVCLTKDKFMDYAGIHPNIIPGRILGFTVVKLDDRMLIAVKGLKRAISIGAAGLKTTFEKSSLEHEANDSQRDCAASVVTRRSGSTSAGGVCSERSAKRYAARTVSKRSKKNLEDIRALVAGDWDYREPLNDDSEKRRAECKRRYSRLRIQAIREGRFHLPHFSSKRREEAGLAALGAMLNYGRVA